MTTFGEMLRAFRQASNDPDRLNKRLSQERLGELIGDKMDDGGVTGAAVSDWERGKSKISAEDWNVLIALTQVLHQCGGLHTLAEANEFLRSGNYRILTNDEAGKIFGEIPEGSNFEESVIKKEISKANNLSLIENLFSVSEAELRTIIAKAQEEGPDPWWPRMLAALMRKVTDRFSISFITILWVWTWLIAWWLIDPSLRLPFANQDVAFRAIAWYIAGTLIVPLMIGALVNTQENAYWKENGMEKSVLLRLYTYQGAGIGFNLGYFFIFPISLARAYLGLEPTVWVEIIAATTGLILGNMGARVVPHNLWRAYRRLKLSDGAIFFVVALLGPIWGLFFFEFYSTLLTPVTGLLIILLAVTFIVIITTRRPKSHDK